MVDQSQITMVQAVISLKNATFGYDGHTTLSDLTVRLAPGSFHFLTGPSGAGKTTLLKLLYMEHRPVSGQVLLFGDDPAGLDARSLTRMRRRVGVVFQDFRLLDHLSLRDNVALPLRVAGKDVAAHASDIDALIRWAGLGKRSDARPPRKEGSYTWVVSFLLPGRTATGRISPDCETTESLGGQYTGS